MKMYSIEVDETIWRLLQKHAEPFVDTPNSVLHKLFLKDFGSKPGEKKEAVEFKGLPKSLSQIFDVLYEIEKNGHTRVEATNIVAHKRGTASTTIMDKYCRYLGLSAQKVDELFKEPGYETYKDMLKAKYSDYTEPIDMFFDALLAGKDVPVEEDVITEPSEEEKMESIIGDKIDSLI